MWNRSIAVAVAVASCAGCLVKETASNLYIEREGSVTWTVVERNVRSDAGSREDRSREESEFLQAARWGTHPTRSALESLWPMTVESVVLRDRRPFTVATTARFRGLDVLAQDFLDRLDVPGRAVLERVPHSNRLVITVDLRSAQADDDGTASPVDPLLDALSELRIVLSAGRFVDASGFRIEHDDVLVVDHEQVEALIEQAEDDLILWIEWTGSEPDADTAR